jgi:mannosyl-3-phosphoglycerate phosphatase
VDVFHGFAAAKYPIDRMRLTLGLGYRGDVRAGKPRLPLVVFSDVDGVLTVPQTLAPAAAATLAPLVRAHVPIVLCSGKTRAELEVLQQELGICQPFVCEGGGAVFIPDGYFDFDVPGSRDVAGYRAIEFGRPYMDVVEQLHRTADRLGIAIVGFNDMTVEEVARDCGIPLLRARLAKLREYQEPFRLLDGSAKARHRLLKGLAAANLRCVNRGRYDHAGAMVDATLGVSALCSLYRRAYGPIVTVGLADAFADDNLLRLVDHRIIVYDDGDTSGAVDILGWAEAIVETVTNLGAVSLDRALASRAN